MTAGSGTTRLVTVVVPVFNRESSIRRAVESALSEANDSLQVIVVDDGSTDQTAVEVAAIADDRVTLLRQENRGVSSARNRGWREARTEYVTFLDSDDEFLHGWWQALVTACRDERVDLWSCAARFRHRDGRITIEAPRPLGPSFGEVTALYLAGTFVVRRELLEACGGYLDGLRFGENTALGLALGGVFERGVTASHTTDPLVEVESRPRPYDAALLDESGGRLLSALAHRCALDPQVAADAYAVSGWAAVRNGRRRVGLQQLWRSWVLEPRQAKRLGRLIAATVRPADQRLERVRRRARGWRRLALDVQRHPSNRGSKVARWWRVARFEVAAWRGRSVEMPFADHSTVIVRKQGDSSSRVAFARLPDWPEMEFWRLVLRPGDLFVDVGANVGLYSLIAAECGATVLAFEPAPDMADACDANFRLNGVEGSVVRAAVSDRQGRAALTGPDPNRRHLVLDDDVAESGALVDTVRLDDVLAGRAPAGIKIDVEGFERLVLLGARQALSSPQLAAVQVEWNGLSQSALNESRAPAAMHLFAAGFRLFQCPPGADRYLEYFGTPPDGTDLIATRSPSIASLLLDSPWETSGR